MATTTALNAAQTCFKTYPAIAAVWAATTSRQLSIPLTIAALASVRGLWADIQACPATARAVRDGAGRWISDILALSDRGAAPSGGASVAGSRAGTPELSTALAIDAPTVAMHSSLIQLQARLEAATTARQNAARAPLGMPLIPVLPAGTLTHDLPTLGSVEEIANMPKRHLRLWARVLLQTEVPRGVKRRRLAQAVLGALGVAETGRRRRRRRRH